MRARGSQTGWRSRRAPAARSDQPARGPDRFPPGPVFSWTIRAARTPIQARLPLRWQFVPVEEKRDRSVRWEWRAYSQTGQLVKSSERTFETLTDCMEDARTQGYGGIP